MIEEVSNYLNQIRHDFSKQSLEESTVKDNPIEQYAVWFEEAVGAQVLDPKAMVLTTVSAEGKPSSRVVYTRGLQNDGMLFYSNYKSKKGQDLEVNPNVSIVIYWAELERQIRIEGVCEKLPSAQSDTYFNSRPRESQIGAWASNQSEEIQSRKELEERTKHFTEKFKNQDVPRPPHWGGYIVYPNRMEFWQGRPARLHDRIVYTKNKNLWNISRLMP